MATALSKSAVEQIIRTGQDPIHTRVTGARRCLVYQAFLARKAHQADSGLLWGYIRTGFEAKFACDFRDIAQSGLTAIVKPDLDLSCKAPAQLVPNQSCA